MSVTNVAGIDCTDHLVDAALWLARGFVDGRRLAVHAPGADDHAHHVAVEFVHPVVVGTRPLPAVAVDHESRVSDAEMLLVIGEAPGSRGVGADLTISSTRSDIDIVRTYHLLWELVQVALEHPGLVGSVGSAGGDATGFLYPFLDAAEHDEAALRDALDASAATKVADSERLVAEALSANTGPLSSAASAITVAVRGGGRVYAMGNGGSATDAARLVRLLHRRSVPALSLSGDYAVVTALVNDVGVERVFARQVEALAAPGDVLVGSSTSGTSANLLAAFAEADTRGLTTIGISGYGGESFATQPSIHHQLAVASSSVHRIQEAQAALIAALCDGVGL